METVRALLIGVHVLAWASLLLSVAWALALRSRRSLGLIPGPAIVAALSGLSLVAVRSTLGLEVIGLKMALKAVLVVIVIVLARHALTRRDRAKGTSRLLIAGVGLATVTNVIIALAWT